METQQKHPNILIAKFMGWRLEYNPIAQPYYYMDFNKLTKEQIVFYNHWNLQKTFTSYFATKAEEFKYGESWDWLMPVIEKIEAINGNEFFVELIMRNSVLSNEFEFTIKVWDGKTKTLDFEWSSKDDAELKTKIDKVYTGVKKFIQFYTVDHFMKKLEDLI